MSTTDDMVTVPRSLLEELLRYIPDEQDDGVEVSGGNGKWHRSMIEQLRPEIERYPAARAVLEHAALHAGELVSLDDIAAASGVPRERFKPELGAMSKATRRLFGRKTWPLQASQSGDGMYYVMDRTIGTWWLSGSESSHGNVKRSATP